MTTGIIVDTKFVRETKESLFHGRVKAEIDALQNEGLGVEVQYQMAVKEESSVGVYTALLIGRRPE